MTGFGFHDGCFSWRPRFALTCALCCALALTVTTLTGTLQRSEAKEDDPARTLGELAAYAERCGYRKDDQWLRSHFGHLQGFKAARRETRIAMEGYDFVRIPCGQVRRIVRKIKSDVEDKPAAKAPTDYEICNFAVTMKDGTASWESREAWLGYVDEAKRRGLTPERCAALLKP